MYKTHQDVPVRALPPWPEQSLLGPAGGRLEALPEVGSTPGGFLWPVEGSEGSRAASVVSGGRPRDSIGVAERHGRRPGPRGGPFSSDLLSRVPGGPRAWRAWSGPREQRGCDSGFDPRRHDRFGRGAPLNAGLDRGLETVAPHPSTPTWGKFED
ncbi:hypothetical protein NDU88_002680 [Pleurodeles waltl]|uniref:Uncharacterized protein n=1 Tax=Pleurodeles waltl TaxID=8319 RepID=A0AAV7MSD4_PLEWA|nr:hypothetical protein NDU88_002680 [Pleurodeles waltl]